jgi:NAD(P)-dependent dehydrogenase (short-subunit alcohol dehydrogenase family)
MSFVERFSVTGRKALVTGGSKGLGLEIASVLADAGADVAVVGRDRAGLGEACAAIDAAGRRSLAIEADLATVEGAQSAAQRALAAFGVVDILVNNAGTTLVQNLLTTPPEGWDRLQAINLRAPFLLAQAVAPKMIAQRRGKIVNISSQAAVAALDNHAAYSASKAGLNMLTKAMTVEWARHNVQANAICPTIVMTAMGQKVWSDPVKSQPMLDRIPLGRFGQPVEIADLTLFLCSYASDLLCGQIIVADGGFTAC